VVDASWIMSNVQWTHRDKRVYYAETPNRFRISVKRKIEKQKKTFVIWVEETESEFVVLNIHLDNDW
jgi:hypothetical protein